MNRGQASHSHSAALSGNKGTNSEQLWVYFEAAKSNMGGTKTTSLSSNLLLGTFMSKASSTPEKWRLQVRCPLSSLCYRWESGTRSPFIHLYPTPPGNIYSVTAEDLWLVFRVPKTAHSPALGRSHYVAMDLVAQNICSCISYLQMRFHTRHTKCRILKIPAKVSKKIGSLGPQDNLQISTAKNALILKRPTVPAKQKQKPEAPVSWTFWKH